MPIHIFIINQLVKSKIVTPLHHIGATLKARSTIIVQNISLDSPRCTTILKLN